LSRNPRASEDPSSRGGPRPSEGPALGSGHLAAAPELLPGGPPPAVGERQWLRPGPPAATGPWAEAFYRLRRGRSALVGLAIVVTFTAAALLAPLIAPADPFRSNFAKTLEAPSREAPLGRDELGRDILSRILYGARISLSIGVVAVGIGVAVGVPLGAVSAYFGGRIDLLVQRVMDIMLAFPGILLALVTVSILGVGLYTAMVAIGVVSIPTYARLVRGSVLSVKEREFVLAARSLGQGDGAIVGRHIFPNCLAPVLVQSTLQIGSAVLSAAALGFLGLGAQPPVPEWGTMLSKGRDFLRVAPHITAFPGLAIMLIVLGFNLLGDGLRDALDPRLKS
jgi:peptide/nickel transport system permease protein